MDGDDLFPNIVFPPSKRGLRIVLTHAPNGGWIMSAADDDLGCMDTIVGAFTSTADMLAALTKGLVACQS